MIFAGELYDESPAFEPLLRAAHHAQDFSWLLAVEVGVGKGSLFTPPHQDALKLSGRNCRGCAARAAGIRQSATFGAHEHVLRKFAPADLANFCYHLLLLRRLLIPVLVPAENLFRIHAGKQTPQKANSIIDCVCGVSNDRFYHGMFSLISCGRRA